MALWGVLGSVWLFFALTLPAKVVSAATIFDHPNPQPSAQFGSAIASVGPVTVGIVTCPAGLLIGAPLQDVGANADQGRAYLICGTTGALLLAIDNPFPQPDARFGAAVASAGDLNGDGKNDLLIGAPRQDVGSCAIGNTTGCSVGQAYVFSSSNGALLRTFNHPFPINSSFFGYSVASAADLNNDGTRDFVIGAPGHGDGGASREGHVFVLSGADGSLLYQINDPNAMEPETIFGFTFGSAVASIGDLTGDGKADIIVGDGLQDVGGSVDQGQVHIFSGATGGFVRTLNLPVAEAGALFGASVAAIADINSDGFLDVLVGAPNHDVGLNPYQGRAFVFSGATGALLLTLNNPVPQGFANFGYAVAGLGDVNSDTIGDLLVGAPGQSIGLNSGQGQAFVFSGSGGALLSTLDNPNPQRDANFGYAVASAGDINGDGKPDPLIGAPFQDVSGIVDQGQVSSPAGTAPVGNQPPVANAGPDQSVNEGSLVNLNGSGSSDPNGDPLTFSWTQTAGPAVTLSNPLVATPTFTAPQVSSNTVLTFQLVVSDGSLSSSDSVNVTVTNVNQPPIANAGPDQTVNEGALVTLNGTGSSDPDGNPLSFTWTQTAGPAVTLSNSSSASPAFTAPLVTSNTVLTFQLVVSDGLLSSSDTVNITVLDTAPCGVDLLGTFSKLTRKTSSGKDTLSFSLDIFNNGCLESRGGFKVKFYISTDAALGSGDALVLTKALKDRSGEGRIKAGNTVTVSGSVTVTSPTQGKFLIGFIDAENTIVESNETNNVVARQIP